MVGIDNNRIPIKKVISVIKKIMSLQAKLREKRIKLDQLTTVSTVTRREEGLILALYRQHLEALHSDF